MNEDFFISKPIGTAASFTLTTRLGEMLRMAEERYGQRDCEFTLLGIEFWPGVPHLWFPGPSDCKHIAIRIGIDAIYDPIKAHFQLAHECIHLLSPVIGMASLLEEGLAVTFSLDYVQRIFGVNYLTGDSRYDKAKGLLDEALIVHPGPGGTRKESLPGKAFWHHSSATPKRCTQSLEESVKGTGETIGRNRLVNH